MTEFIVILVIFLVGLGLGYGLMRFGGHRGPAGVSRGHSPILAHLEKSGLPDTNETVTHLKSMASKGLEASGLKAENEALRKRNDDLKRRAERQPQVEQSTPTAPTIVSSDVNDPSNTEIRDRAREAIEEIQALLPTSRPDADQMLSVTGFFDALEFESEYRFVRDKEEVSSALNKDWFSQLHRSEALLDAYFREQTPLLLMHLSTINDALRQSAAAHGFHVAPVRLLMPGSATGSDAASFADLASIATIEAKLASLADNLGSGADLSIAIDMVSPQITDVSNVRDNHDGMDLSDGSILLSAKTITFRPEDWRR